MSKLKGLLSTLAPTVGKAIGGPMGGMAVKLVADKLGVSNPDQTPVSYTHLTLPTKRIV